MALKHLAKFVAPWCLLASLQSVVFSQAIGGTNETRQSGSPFSTEESGAATPRLAKRESELRVALAAQPNSAEILYTLALVLRQEGKPRASLATYTESARLRKPTIDELRSVALDYVLLNDYEDAIHWLEVAAQMDPKDTNTLYALGRCYYSKDRFADASRMYERVIAIEPKHLKAEENLGLTYDATNFPDKAEDALRKAASWADQNGADEWPFLDLGGFLLEHDRAKESIDALRTAIHIRTGCAPCHEKLRRALLATQDSTGAIAELEQATRLDSMDPKTHYELGRALRQAGQGERAKQEFSLSQKLYAAHSQE